MKQITSRTNPLYRSWKNLLAAKGIREEGALLISGRKLVPEFITAPNYRPQALIVSDPKDVEQLAFKKDLDVFWLAKDLFKELDESGTYFPLLVAQAPALNEVEFASSPKGLEIFLTLSNPQNLGAVLRSCEAFQARQIYLLKECAHPFLPKVIRSSSGSSLRVPLQLGPSIQNLPEKVIATISALDMHGENLATSTIEKNIRLLIGEEGQGVPKNFHFHKTLSIPIKKNMDSLNASVAASIALFAYRSQHPMT